LILAMSLVRGSVWQSSVIILSRDES